MNPTVKNILAVVAGIVIGMVVNMAIVMLSASVIPPPGGVNPNDVESVRAGLHLFEPKHFIFPFLAHALGTLAGAFAAAKIAANSKQKLALWTGVIFLAFGILAATMIPAPTWFIAVDLILAYVPMGILGGKLASR